MLSIIKRPAHVQMTLAVFTSLSLFAAPAADAQPADKLADKLATLRAEVEQLSEALTEAKTETRNELQALARQRSDLQVELDREAVRVQKLRAQLDNKRAKLADTSEAGQALQPVYDLGLRVMREYVENSMPFRRGERLNELDKLDEQRRQGVLTYPRALTRLWGFVEDEFRMTRESAVFQQSISLDGKQQLAEVIRVGMVMLFFKTNDGIVGFTARTDAGWQFVRAPASADKNNIRRLFDSFKKQIRVGLFVLPAAMPKVTNR